jgi:hypothetical protein
MAVVWSKVLPVLVSIGIIILIAILREYSKTLAAIASTMPINIPLALWIIYGAEGQRALPAFAQSLFFNIWPTLVFLLIAWLGARAGWSLPGIIGAGYVGWAAGLGAVLLVRGLLGV